MHRCFRIEQRTKKHLSVANLEKLNQNPNIIIYHPKCNFFIAWVSSPDVKLNILNCLQPRKWLLVHCLVFPWPGCNYESRIPYHHQVNKGLLAGLIQGNQWWSLRPDHKGPRLFLEGGTLWPRGGLVDQSWYCWWLKSCTTWDVWNLINNGINYQPQLVQDFSHQQYESLVVVRKLCKDMQNFNAIFSARV